MLSNQIILALAAAACMVPFCHSADPYSHIFNKLGHIAPLPRVPAEYKERVIASLPKDGELRKLSREQLGKVEALAAVLQAHGRNTDYIFKIVKSPQARIAIHARIVLLVTDTALHLLNPSQLQAVVAHEIGHEYVWEEYEKSWNSRNWHRVRELELFCDGIALQTLFRMRVASSALIDALRTMHNSDERNGLVADAVIDSHPSLAERARFAQEMSKRLAVDPESIKAFGSGPTTPR